MPSTTATHEHPTTSPSKRDPLYASLIGLTALAILLQGLWAGFFIREGKGFDESTTQANMVIVHDWGARAAIVLALAALVVAVLRLRNQRALLIGTGALTALLMLEAYIGGEIGNKPDWPNYHFPLAMALMALAVWLPIRATRR